MKKKIIELKLHIQDNFVCFRITPSLPAQSFLPYENKLVTTWAFPTVCVIYLFTLRSASYLAPALLWIVGTVFPRLLDNWLLSSQKFGQKKALVVYLRAREEKPGYFSHSRPNSRQHLCLPYGYRCFWIIHPSTSLALFQTVLAFVNLRSGSSILNVVTLWVAITSPICLFSSSSTSEINSLY